MRSSPDEDRDAAGALRDAVAHAGHLLPMQGPIGVFVHHNTLHAYQHLPFEDAVTAASEQFGTEPYMTEQQFRAAIWSERILPEDIAQVLEREPNAPVVDSLDRRTLRRLMLHPGVRQFDSATIRWELEEGGLTDDPRDRALFQVCLDRLQADSVAPARAAARPRDGVLALTGADLDETVHPVLIRLTGAFLDQGMAYWPMPDREYGLYIAIRKLTRRGGAVFPEDLAGLDAEFAVQAAAGMNSEMAVLRCLERLGVPPPEWESLLTAEAIALPGWAGMMHRLEQEPGLAPHESVPCSLMDFLAVRLTIEVVAAERVLSRVGLRLSEWRAETVERPSESQHLVRVATLFDAARLCDLRAEGLRSLPSDRFDRFQQEVSSFGSVERRRILQLAYELRHEDQILTPLAQFRREIGTPRDPECPTAQVFFCIDEREESTRRHLEEIAPDVETLSAAGFYGVAVDYAGIDDAHGVSLCPIVIKPRHAVRERPVAEHREAFERRRAMRSLWARAARTGFVSSRTLIRGAISTATLGVFSLFPLIAHVLTPRFYSRLTNALNRWILPEPRTELTLMREKGQDAAESLLPGFTPEEKADRVASVLRPAGLVSRFAPVVVVLGHGSTSLNNPHESAHDCGACGGRRGGPNARLFATMANRERVRAILRGRGIDIPDTTWFIGGYHDTCSDEIEYFDTEYIPSGHLEAFEAVRRKLDLARHLDAHERSRRFEAASPRITPKGALWHVQERSEHLAEPRPEYGHCTNAVCIVGRRSLTRGLFFDRRAFLVSYDPSIDPAGENLRQALGAAIPVCAGISLEYYFSFVDNEGYGCGTKLPHNVTGLVGVMNGPASDLRTGLPWQMVEIHEPVRILFVIEADCEVLTRAIHSSPLLRQFVENRWVRVSTIHPETGHIHVWRDGRFEPRDAGDFRLPQAASSTEWYSGKREHLPVARIGTLQHAI